MVKKLSTIQDNTKPDLFNDQSDSTRDRLLQTAEEMFAEKGFTGTSLRSIGEALGIANSSVLYYFPSKKKLYAAVLQRIDESIITMLDDLPVDPDTGVADLRDIIERLLAWIRVNPGSSKIVLREVLDNSERVSQALNMWVTTMIDAMYSSFKKIKSEGNSELDPAMFVFQMIGVTAYMSLALPLVGMYTNNRDLDDLANRSDAAILYMIDSLSYGLANRPKGE